MFGVMDTRKRLLISQFMFGMMLWYGIEQLFINTISHDSGARGYVTIAFTVSLLVFDLPTGILADKFGRKRSLLVGCMVAITSLVLLGASNSLAFYLIGGAMFGLFISFHNGAAEALLYDWLANKSQTKLYGKYQGGIYAAYLLGAGVANVLSGFIANVYGLRSTYLLSIIPVVVGFWLLLGIEEPAIQKMKTKIRWHQHLRDVAGVIRSNPRIIAFGLQLIITELLFLTVAEFGQIYMLSFGISAVTLGLFWAADAVFAAAGRGYAHRAQKHPRQLVLIFCVVLGAFALVTKNIGIGLFWLMWGMTEMLANVAETEIQHETSSNIRATMLSTISFLGNLIGVPIIFAYIAYFKSTDIFTANRAIIAGCIIVLLLTLFARPHKAMNTPAGAQQLPPKVVI